MLVHGCLVEKRFTVARRGPVTRWTQVTLVTSYSFTSLMGECSEPGRGVTRFLGLYVLWGCWAGVVDCEPFEPRKEVEVIEAWAMLKLRRGKKPV